MSTSVLHLKAGLRRLPIALVAATLIGLLPATAAVAATIQAPLKTATDGLDPNATVWSTVPQYSIALDTVISTAGVPQILPKAKWKYVLVKAYQDGTDIYFRYQWPDPVPDMDVSDTGLFADGFAMEIPYGLNASIAMGNQFEPVNILFWRADLANPQNIVAGGAGTVQTSPDSDDADMDPATQPPVPLSVHSQSWVNGRWTIVIKRPLSGDISTNGNLVALVPRSIDSTKGNYRITFGQWDGGNHERDGVKLVTGSWQTLYLP
ncbi:MAG: ethylbenzene dehydrogenase-related protein [Chromatiaceae bacterium]|jgi:DMSO reductase family type II enzyme heme b subunit|nr:ethylbenzene dehydrogenase-related protein [Chromatiaceae bacterium]